MDKRLNLSNLIHIYTESIERQEPTLAFELANGKGRFLFLMFFDDDDLSTKDNLFIFMKNTQKMECIKMYGNHKNGQFWIYKTSRLEKLFKDELLLNNNSTKSSFEFDQFFYNLNHSIPTQLSLKDKIKTFRNEWHQIKNHLPKDIIDESLKIHLIGVVKLPPNKKPREKTLRKLYLYKDSSPSDIRKLIDNLKKLNMTLAWTSNKEESKLGGIIEIINSIE